MRNTRKWQYIIHLLIVLLMVLPTSSSAGINIPDLPEKTKILINERLDKFKASRAATRAQEHKTLVAEDLKAEPTLAAEDSDDKVWNLKDVDILTLISHVSKETGKNFIVDPAVKGKITMISNSPMTPDELYQAFLSVLRVHGFSAVDSGNVIKIIPDSQGKSTLTPEQDQLTLNQHEEIVVEIVHAEHVSVTEIQRALQPLVSKFGHITAYAPTNDLVIADRADNVERFKQITDELDQAEGDEVEIVPLKHAAAFDLLDTLNMLEARKSGTIIKATGQQKTNLAADERTNSILIGGNKANRKRLKSLVKKLDLPAQNGGHTQVIHLKYLRAIDVAPIISGFIAGKEDAAGVRRSISASRSSSRPTSRRGVTLGGDTSLATGAGGMGTTSVFGEKEPKGGVISQNVQWESTTNSIIVTAPPSMMDSIHEVLKHLDIRRPQVLVEAIIAEINITKATELGVEWQHPGGDVRVATRFPDPKVSSITDASTLDTTLKAVSDVLTGSMGAGLTMGFFKDGDLRAILRALTDDTAANILATPNILTLDNEEAQIKVGDRITFATSEADASITTGGTATTFFDREDVGLSLNIRPQITPVGAIKLEILQTLSRVLPVSPGVGGNPDTAERSIMTNVMVDDGEILVLGGLIQEEWQEGEVKVPLLGDIPIIGHLFKSQSKQLVKKNLMIFLRPTIIRDKAKGIEVTDNRYQKMRNDQLKARAGKEKFYSKKSSIPILPAKAKPGHLPPPFEM